ncbi:hypothetical protein Leryth_014688 [Lithospermum erythrorhizon]|nr:hypothetical protein Leryth_014688 [Lithospermum erythrorhizon]
MERIWKPNVELAPNCPRCASSNTKFCYYNNYSSSQPRYFCKGCRRYWTKGGSLRNVPLGGGCRKTRRSKSARNGGSSHATSSDHGSSIDDSKQGNAAEIDLAAVFAKYVNPDKANDDHQDNSSGGSNSSGSSLKSSFSPETEEQLENGYFECQNPLELSDLLQLDDDQQRVVHHSQVSETQNLDDLLEFQSILGDDQTTHFQDLTWPDYSSLPNVALQQPPMVQLEDFGSFSIEDHLNMQDQANLVSDNWSTFDFPSGYDFLPTLT